VPNILGAPVWAQGPRAALRGKLERHTKRAGGRRPRNVRRRPSVEYWSLKVLAVDVSINMLVGHIAVCWTVGAHWVGKGVKW
jgi:hypothetical protein